jgi:hypothetical protein
VFKFRDISRKVFTVFKSVFKMPKFTEIVAPLGGIQLRYPGLGRLDSITSANQATENWTNLAQIT